MMRSKRTVSLVLAASVVLGGFVALTPKPAAAMSNEKAWRYGTYALGAGTVYAFARHKGTLGLIGAAGTYLAYRKWQGAKNRRRANDRWGRQSRGRRASTSYSHRRR
jgi:hypothetical protein